MLFSDGITSSVKTTPKGFRLIHGPSGILSIKPAFIIEVLRAVFQLCYQLLVRHRDWKQYRGKD